MSAAVAGTCPAARSWTPCWARGGRSRPLTMRGRRSKFGASSRFPLTTTTRSARWESVVRQSKKGKAEMKSKKASSRVTSANQETAAAAGAASRSTSAGRSGALPVRLPDATPWPSSGQSRARALVPASVATPRRATRAYAPPGPASVVCRAPSSRRDRLRPRAGAGDRHPFRRGDPNDRPRS